MKHQAKHPPSFTLGEASKQFTVSKSTLSKDRKSGKLSANRQPDGSYHVSYAELHRVYGEKLKPRTVEETVGSNDSQPLEHQRETPEKELLKAKLEAAERLLEERQQTIDDLRTRLDTEGEERRKLTAMITDQRQQESRGFWSRLFRKT